MELYGKTVCVTFEELVGGGILTESNYKKLVRSQKLTVLTKGGNGRKARVAYDSLPEKFRSAYDMQNPNARKEMEKRLTAITPTDERLKSDDRAVEYFRSCTPAISLERQAEYVLNAKVLNALAAKASAMTELHSASGYRRPKLVSDELVALSERLRERYGHTLPKSRARLLEKYNHYRRYGYEVLANGNFGNQTARKIGPAEGRVLIRLRRSKFPVYTEMQIFEEYNRIAKEKGLSPVKSPQTVSNYLNKTAVKLWWFASVHGEVAFKNEFMPTFDTKMPDMPNTLWYGDGTKVNLYYKEYDRKSKRMVARTTDVYEVMDACTEAFIGYSFGPERFSTQYSAYRMALETCKVKPYEIVTDNQGGHKRADAVAFLGQICHLHKTTMPHNAQSKSIESAFGRFQSQVLHKMYNFTGQNITARKRGSRVNLDMITANIESLPTREDMMEQYLHLRDEWNNSPHTGSETGLTRMEMQASLCCPYAEQVEGRELAELFMLTSAKSVEYGTEGYCFTLNKQEYRYMVYGEDGLVDMNFHLSNVGESFHYRYDPADMTRIELWKPTASGLVFAAVATPKVSIHRATADRAEEEDALLFAQLRANEQARVAMHIASEEMLLDECAGEAYAKLNIPRPVGVSKKRMDAYREAYATGKIEAPVSYPDGTEPVPFSFEEEDEQGIATVGEFTKAASELTWEEMYGDF